MILNGYWTVVWLYLLAALLGLVFAIVQSPWWVGFYLYHRMLIPTAVLIGIVGALEIAFRTVKSPRLDIWFILTATAIAFTVVFYNPNLHGMYAMFALSTLTSIMYFDRKRALLSCLLSIGALLVLQASPEHQASMTVYEIIAMIAMLIGAYLLGVGIILRGDQLRNQLKKAMESERDLLVDNIMYDTITKLDALTSLYNHKTFHEYLDSLLKLDLTSLRLQVALIDIDNFKMINDTYGHWVGDIVLKRIALMIREHLTPNDFVARYGGEEFAVILTDAEFDTSWATLDRIRELIAAEKFEELGDHTVTVSIGLVQREPGLCKEDLFKTADARLYEAKRTGKNRVVGTLHES
ncbi:diguanylate cyclase (GGDEF)-like protein [Tumebacillus permanentifrigoris]|uniref:Diguanylate cyclase (GGDEF)-like protein n=2 Tax=Tumebacillus permanentifrigoris TaxID=378543 RepID=A0A316DSN2_9BACL|nr:diguanylate cyclase (GGDEF)-like protein [Tumebacillus permanentifrigoris]